MPNKQNKKVFESMDGNQAAAHSSYAFTEVAGIYPITPSSPMAEFTDEWASKGKLNLFNMPVKVVEMQSEAGAAGTVHGSLQAGALTTTYTASQGLLLKVPNMYKIAGELLPGVIHVSARSIAAHSLSIFGDHQDVMACRQTGFAIMASSSVQEVMDCAGVAHLAAIKSSIPFLHFFDGFRTSHEVQKVEVMDYKVFEDLLDKKAVERFRKNALNPNNPKTRGSAQNDDVYFQGKEVANKLYEAVPSIVEDYLSKISEITGRKYAPFVYYGAKDATSIIISMGSVNETIEEVVDYLNSKGEKVGCVKVMLYRPFSVKHLLSVVPTSVKKIAVLDRTKEPGAIGEPLFMDVKASFYGSSTPPLIIGGIYGLSSKDTTPGQIFAVFDNLKCDKPKTPFTIGIVDDVTYRSLEITKEINLVDKETTQLIFWGIGSDGTVGANKNTIKLIGDYTPSYAQAYFPYDSKKSGGVTRSHLRFGKKPIKSPYLIQEADFVSCAVESYMLKYEILKPLKQNGTFLLNTSKNKNELIEFLPKHVLETIINKNISFYCVDANSLAEKIGLKGRTNTILQSSFFKLNEQIMPYSESVELMKKFAYKSYIGKGEKVVELNYKAIEEGAKGLVEIKLVKEDIKNKKDLIKKEVVLPKFVRNIAKVVNDIKGYELPVSVFFDEDYRDGSMENGSSAYEKREVSQFTPNWNKDNCIQCNQCAFVCPHAVIRPFLLTQDEVNKAPKDAQYIKAMGKGLEEYLYTLQISYADCYDCRVCINACPGKVKINPDGTKINEKALVVENATTQYAKQATPDYFFNNVSYKKDLVDIYSSPKNSQFAKPYFEFSGACAGCGETPYIKLVTQLFGDRMLIANATGCTSIYGGSYPSTPYTKDKEGKGPAWSNSLFEDNAEFGFGMRNGVETIRSKVEMIMEKAINENKVDEVLKELFVKWITNKDDYEITKGVSDKLIPLLEKNKEEYATSILEMKNYLVKISQWMFGGDGWAYDIGYGGLDHVIANSEDVNILVLDTEVYSNTGGQSSKSSPTASIAKFTASGKKGKKKDLAYIAMSYGHVYVASIAHGASQAQMLKALKEAESYKGPSIVIAYAPCISHGLKSGMGTSQIQAKLAVECGYWTLFRYDPRLIEKGENPFILDSKEPNWDKYDEYLQSETRYASLKAINPTKATELLKINKEEAQRRYNTYKKML